MINIDERLLSVNKYSRPSTKIGKIKNIVVHYVGNTGSTAVANRNYFEGLKTGSKGVYASSHYIVGLNGEVVRCVPDNEVAYHASKANSYSLGIEVCHPTNTGEFNEKSRESLIELLEYLCVEYDLSPDTDIIRHYDVTGKNCPAYYVLIPKAWEQIKKDVSILMDKGEELNPKQVLIKRMCEENKLSESWVDKWDKTLTVYELFAILDKVVK